MMKLSLFIVGLLSVAEFKRLRPIAFHYGRGSIKKHLSGLHEELTLKFYDSY